jgi:hypothetical protein
LFCLNVFYFSVVLLLYDCHRAKTQLRLNNNSNIPTACFQKPVPEAMSHRESSVKTNQMLISLFVSRCSHLEHRASVKSFVSLQVLTPKTVGRAPWIADEPIARPLPTQTQNKHRHPCLEWDSIPRSQHSIGRRQWILSG